MVALFLGYLFIFFARIVDVSLQTLRVLLLVRGKRIPAAVIGFFEVILYIVVLKHVVDRLDDVYNLIVYAAGYASGNLLGGFIEEKMAFGHVTVQVITLCRPHQLSEELRSQGFGVTVLEGQGREGVHHILHIILSRRELQGLLKTVNEWDCKAFVTVLDTKATKGGYFHSRKAK